MAPANAGFDWLTSEMQNVEYKPIIGMEIHVQLCTESKMFCACGVSFAAPANSRVCPVCIGMPGVLPVMNRRAFEYAVLVGLALNCRIAGFTKWDRKNYYYPDLPKNYQISQYDLPLAHDGYIEIVAEPHRTRRIGIIRAHLEEDAGKNLHSAGGFSQVDLNRAGTPLLEIVTCPDMDSLEQVRALATQLQRMVRYLGVSEADMQKGHLRFEPNVNLKVLKDGKEYRTPIVEIKNLNSFRALEKSVAYEIERQLDEFLQTGRVFQPGTKTTRGWDDVNEVTILQREKEEAHDYRYFPDPDLVPVQLDDEWLQRIKSGLCELPVHRQRRFVEQYGLSDYDAGVLTAERYAAELFEQVVKQGRDPKRVCNLLTQTGMKLANERNCSIAQLGITADSLSQLAGMVDSGDVSAGAAGVILEQMVKTAAQPRQLAAELNLLQKSQVSELEAIVDEAIAANPKTVEDIKSGGKKSQKALSFLLGQVMQRSGGRANPKIVSEILTGKLQ